MLLHHTVRDRVAGLALFFYVLPPLVVVGVTLISTALLARRRALRWVVFSLVAALAALATWIRTDYAWGGLTTVPADLRIVLWNIGGHGRQEPFADALKEAESQVVLLLESGRPGERRRAFWQSHLPDHSVTFLPGGATLLCRYPRSPVSTHRTGRRTFVHTCAVNTPAGPVSLVMADVESNLLSVRGPLLARIYEIASSLPSPRIVLGDFNTPHTSAFFDAFRRSFRHAFESSGRGMIPTWPALCPALTLDHIWLSRDLTPVRAKTVGTFHSDHAMVIADVKLAPPTLGAD